MVVVVVVVGMLVVTTSTSSTVAEVVSGVNLQLTGPLLLMSFTRLEHPFEGEKQVSRGSALVLEKRCLRSSRYSRSEGGILSSRLPGIGSGNKLSSLAVQHMSWE